MAVCIVYIQSYIIECSFCLNLVFVYCIIIFVCNAVTVCRDYIVITGSTIRFTGKDNSCLVSNNFDIADYRSSYFYISFTSTFWLLLEQKKFQNKSKNIDEVYQSVFFRCIMFLSYRVTFLCNVFSQTHYTSESPVRYFFMKKL